MFGPSPNQESRSKQDLLSIEKSRVGHPDTSPGPCMSRNIGSCFRQRVRIPGKGFCLLPWSTSPMQNVQFNSKAKQFFNFVMQGKCQKADNHEKIRKFRPLILRKSTMEFHWVAKLAIRPKISLAKDQIANSTCAAIGLFVSLAGQYCVTNDKMWRWRQQNIGTP